MSHHRRRGSAALIFGFALAGCTTAVQDGTTEATPSPTDTATATPSPDATPSPEATESAGPTVLEVAWTVPFSLTAPAGWSTDVSEGVAGTKTGNGVWFGMTGQYLAMSRSGPDTVDAWVESVTTAEQLIATEPVEVEIGGAPGYRVDLRTSDAATDRGCIMNGRCYTLFSDDSGYWPIEEGRPTRAWFVDVDGETLIIAVDAPEAAFERSVATVEEALATLTWTD